MPGGRARSSRAQGPWAPSSSCSRSSRSLATRSPASRAKRRSAGAAARDRGRTGSPSVLSRARRRGRTFNSAAYLEGGKIVHVHRKLYLVGYPPFEETALFAPGTAMRAFTTALGRFAVMICNDAWQPALPGDRRCRRGSRTACAGGELDRGGRGRAHLARAHPLLRAHACVLRRVREPGRRRGRTRVLGRLARRRPVRGTRGRSATPRGGIDDR